MTSYQYTPADLAARVGARMPRSPDVPPPPDVPAIWRYEAQERREWVRFFQGLAIGLVAALATYGLSLLCYLLYFGDGQ